MWNYHLPGHDQLDPGSSELVKLVNSCCAACILENKYMFSHSIWFLNTEIASWIEILYHRKQGLAYPTHPYYGCQWPGSAMSQGTNNSAIDLVALQYSNFSTIGDSTVITQGFPMWGWWITYNEQLTGSVPLLRQVQYLDGGYITLCKLVHNLIEVITTWLSGGK